MKPFSIRMRIFLGMMAVISGFLVLTSIVIDHLVDGIVDEEVSASLARGNDAYRSFVDTRNSLLIDKARSLGQAPHLRALLGTPDVDAASFADMATTLGEAAAADVLFIANAAGDIVADTKQGLEPGQSLTDLPGSGTVFYGDDVCDVWVYGGGVYVMAIGPVTLGSAVLGVVGMGYVVDTNAANTLCKVTGQDVTVLHDGRVLATAWRGGVAAELGSSLAAWSDLPQGERRRFSADGRQYLAAAVPMSTTGASGATLVLSRPLDETLGHYLTARRNLFLIAAALALLGLIASQLIAGRIARPIQALSRAADDLAHGDFQAEVEVDSNDEVGELGRSFNEMARRIEELILSTNEKAEAAEEASRAKSAFLATMSHEIRTPLAGVLGLSDQLLETQLSSHQRDLLETVLQSGLDLQRVINDILDFSSISSEQATLEHSDLDLEELLRRSLDAVRDDATEKGLDLALDYGSDVPRSLIGSAGRLRQIVLNFLSNAIKFTHSGKVIIRTRVQEETDTHATIRTEVVDTGIGIAQKDLALLFTPFSQVDSSYARRFGGTGLGLAICKDLVAMMSGTCGVESAPGSGSTFWFVVTLEKQLEPDASSAELEGPGAVLPHRRPPDPDAPTTWRKSQRILIVEDNRVNQKMASLIVGKAGWDYEIAEDGGQALAKMKAASYDLVLMDCQMPIMDGLEATRRIRKDEVGSSERVPIVALTANTLEGDRERCLDAGMDDFVGKPFKASHLVQVLDNWLHP